MDIKFPVFVLAKDSGEVLKFNSLEEMQTYMEPIDVENAEYEAWDRAGRPLRLAVQTPMWLRVDLASSSQDSSRMGQVLENYARTVGSKANISVTEETDIPAVYDAIVNSRPPRHKKRDLLSRIFRGRN